MNKGTMYVGMTTNIIRRIKDHKKGIESIHTMGREIHQSEILWHGNVTNKYHAMLLENAYAKRMKQKYTCYKVYGGELSPRFKKIIIKKAFAKNNHPFT